MKVENNRPSPPPATASSASAGAARAKKANRSEAQASNSAKGAKDHSSASPEISLQGKELAQVRAAADQAPDVRQAKVDDLKARIASGTYQIDPSAIASAMVDDHLAMTAAGA